ncbi:MAG: TetR/AcrR family transcriptional regulator [Ilumatobacteraceae bacterium]
MRTPTTRPTRERILDASLDAFGSRGVEAVSLDDIAGAVGVRKQTVLYWFPSKDHLVAAVLERSADELEVAIEAAVRQSGEGFARVEAVVDAAFRSAVRRPALLGLVRELHRLGPALSDRVVERLSPFAARAKEFLAEEMDAGRMRRADPQLVVALAYATITGVATEPEALRAVGWEPSPAGLRRLRRELVGLARRARRPRAGTCRS